MNIFKVNQNGEAEVDVAWIRLVKQFDALFDGRKAGASRYSKTALGRRLLAFIYFYEDFSSPIHNYTDEDRFKEALNYTDLTKKQVSTDIVKEALEAYKQLQLKSCRPLRTYQAAMKGMTAMDKYLEEIDFSLTDKQGKVQYTPNQFIIAVEKVNKSYDELEKLEQRVERSMGKSSGIRGKAELGGREKRNANKGLNQEEWDEGTTEPMEKETQWKDLQDLLGTDVS
jgi:hypothetical protein